MNRYLSLLLVVVTVPLHAQPGKKSQLATLTQVVDKTKIEIIYRRPVALWGRTVVPISIKVR